jgi:hypothetical protein
MESVSRFDPDSTRCVYLDPAQQKITSPPPPQKKIQNFLKWLEDHDVLLGEAVASPEVWSSQTVSLQSLPLQSPLLIPPSPILIPPSQLLICLNITAGTSKAVLLRHSQTDRQSR